MNVSPALVTQMEALIEQWRDKADLLHPLLSATYLRDCADQLQPLLVLLLEQQRGQRTIKSIATMLGWDNVPPQRTLEMDISTLKARVVDSQAEVQRLKAINSELCSEHNGLLADGARWQRRAEAAEAEIQRLTDALDAENDIIVCTDRTTQPAEG
jgi:FtsZ-binding cell division protein ZapB